MRELVQRRLRRRFRLVTLDDSSFKPLGPLWTGIAASLAPPVSAVLAMVAIYFAAMDSVTAAARGEAPEAGALYVLYSLALPATFLVFAFVILVLAAAVSRSHRSAHRTINDSSSKEKTIRGVRWLASFWRGPAIAGPLATTIATSDDQWQSTVLALSKDLVGRAGRRLPPPWQHLLGTGSAPQQWRVPDVAGAARARATLA